METKEKIIINLDGDSYIKLKMYEARQKEMRSQKRNNYIEEHKYIIMYCLFLLVFLIAVYVLTYTPPVSSPVAWETIFKFLLASVGLGWILHGVGFSIVGKLS